MNSFPRPARTQKTVGKVHCSKSLAHRDPLPRVHGPLATPELGQLDDAASIPTRVCGQKTFPRLPAKLKENKDNGAKHTPHPHISPDHHLFIFFGESHRL